MSKLKRIAILASGNGSNLEAILKEVRSGNLPVEVAFCFSDNPTARALERARNLGFETVQFAPKDFESREKYEEALAARLETARVDFVILAGYMRLLGAKFVHRFQDRILNIHPALLPSFKGTHGIRDAWEYGMTVTGVTVHFVNEEMDGGPIVAQEAVAITEGETLESLEERLHRIEHRLYPEAIKKVVTKNFKIEGRRVVFLA